jgi:hypothetical protein
MDYMRPLAGIIIVLMLLLDVGIEEYADDNDDDH